VLQQSPLSFWSLAVACLSSSSLIKVFRDSTITSSGISSEAYPLRVATYFIGSSYAFFFMTFSGFSLILAFCKRVLLGLGNCTNFALAGSG